MSAQKLRAGQLKVGGDPARLQLFQLCTQFRAMQRRHQITRGDWKPCHITPDSSGHIVHVYRRFEHRRPQCNHIQRDVPSVAITQFGGPFAGARKLTQNREFPRIRP